MDLVTLTLGPDQVAVLKTILEFHLDDEPGAYYPFEPFKELCEKVGVPVPPEPST